MKETMGKVVFGFCGWKGRRKTGNIAYCPVCDTACTFEPSDDDRNKIFNDKKGDL